MIRSYRSKSKGLPTFVYTVTGTAEQLAAYKEAQGTYYREDEENKAPLWFTTRCIGPQGKILITTNGNIVADMSEFDQAASLAAQYGGNLGTELARTSAQRLMGGRGAMANNDAPDDIAEI